MDLLTVVRKLLFEDLLSSDDYLILCCEYLLKSDIHRYSWKNCVISHKGFVTSNDQSGPYPFPPP
jgi:hypothetical protein